MSNELRTELEALLGRVTKNPVSERSWFQIIFIMFVVILFCGAGAIFAYRKWWDCRGEDEEVGLLAAPVYKRLLETVQHEDPLIEESYSPKDPNFTSIDAALGAVKDASSDALEPLDK